MGRVIDYLVFYGPPPYRPLGSPYAVWATRWYEWVQSITRDKNPVRDVDGKNSHQKQHGSVWFLAGTVGGSAARMCSIPKDTDIFFPIINEMSTTSQYKKSGSELLNHCASIIDQVNHKKVAFDDQKLEGSDLDLFRVRTELFNITLPDNNLCAVEPGPTQAICDGYWVMIRGEALSLGNHTLYFVGEQKDGFRTEVTYYLTIQ